MKIEDFFNGNKYCHIDYKKIQKANFTGGFFAIFPPNLGQDFSNLSSKMEKKERYLLILGRFTDLLMVKEFTQEKHLGIMLKMPAQFYQNA